MAHDFHPTCAGGKDFWQHLGIVPRGVQLYGALHHGLPYDVFDHLADAIDLNRSILAQHLGIAPATLQRRLKVRQFNTEESDRLFRLASIYKASLDLFEGDDDAARRWMCHPITGLDQRRPLDMLMTSAESQAVLDLVGRLEHGVMA